MNTSDNCWCLRWSSPCNRAVRCMMWFLCALSCAMAAANESWESPGCHLVGRTLDINIPNCVEFSLPANACYGYCESSAVATSPDDLKDNPNQVITSISSCCDMDETEDIIVSVPCVKGLTDHTFRSPKSCKCSQCQKDSH